MFLSNFLKFLPPPPPPPFSKSCVCTIFWNTFFCGDRLKNFFEALFFFFGEHCLVLVSLVLALASSIPVLDLESVCPRKGCPWPWPQIFFVSLALASSLVSSTPPLLEDVLEAKDVLEGSTSDKQKNFQLQLGSKIVQLIPRNM